MNRRSLSLNKLRFRQERPIARKKRVLHLWGSIRHPRRETEHPLWLMARSAEALARRAAKRKVSVTTQRSNDAKKPKQKANDTRNFNESDRYQALVASPDTAAYNSALTEAGSWVCSRCGNNNFASRRVCNSKTCDEKSPHRQQQKKLAPAHLPSMKGKWAAQKDKQGVEWQQHLRRCYRGEEGCDMTSLSEEEKARAKILVERDERRAKKKVKQKVAKEKVLAFKQRKIGGPPPPRTAPLKSAPPPVAPEEEKSLSSSSSSCPSSSEDSSSEEE